ncbi:MAG: hypothetical protein ACYCW6_07545, partial [Candidatus Xenobia bacterium]
LPLGEFLTLVDAFVYLIEERHGSLPPAVALTVWYFWGFQVESSGASLPGPGQAFVEISRCFLL